ncbi:probable G-protein coupled receptor 19 isoform X1 [Sebastes umbrosus]|uniref:probable G-protein coupled receptor 19 isoform X1 n=1 Tax=Sebastes umbrosus TaxID=72105 RepID=UPI00189CA0ED|nr:probable G-protein coupled receptor 19 isoform X1 [Sebastes umbrosus]
MELVGNSSSSLSSILLLLLLPPISTIVGFPWRPACWLPWRRAATANPVSIRPIICSWTTSFPFIEQRGKDGRHAALRGHRQTVGYIQLDRETDRWTERQTAGQRDRQVDRQPPNSHDVCCLHGPPLPPPPPPPPPGSSSSPLNRINSNMKRLFPLCCQPMSFNFSERENSTVLATLPTTPHCSLEGSSSGQPNGTVASDELTSGEVAVLGLVFGVLWLVSILGNALVCLVIHRSRRTQSTTNYFVVSMACADLLMSLGWAPFILMQVASGRWPLSAAACKAVRYLQHLCPGVQVYVLLSISVDRFYTIVYPLSFKVSREKAKKMIVASWLFDAAFVSPCLFFYGSTSGSSHCDFFLPDSWSSIAYAAVHLLFGFLVPVALIVSFYQRVVRYIWRISADGHTVRRTMNIVPRTKVKTIKMFLMLNTVFFLTWTPFYVAQLWHPRESDGPGRQGLLFFSAIAWVSFSSTASKPTLYSVYNANFRRGMRETFCMSSMKCYRSNAYTITASSRMAKKNYIGVVEIPVQAKTVAKDSVYDTFGREAKEKKVAWTTNANPPNTFV